MALVCSEILDITVENHSLGKDRAYLLAYLREESADQIEATSPSGYKLQCLEIADREWSFEVLAAPELEVS